MDAGTFRDEPIVDDAKFGEDFAVDAGFLPNFAGGGCGNVFPGFDVSFGHGP